MAVGDVREPADERRTPSGGRLALARTELRRSSVTHAILTSGAVVIALLVVAHGVNAELLGDRTFLALDRDANFPAWVQTALFVVAGLACWALAWLERAVRVPWAALGLVALLLSLEQMAQLHTRVERDLGDVATLALEPLMAVALIAVVALAARGLPLLSQALLWSAIGAIAVAQGSSMVNAELDLPHAGIVAFQTLEEIGEIATAVLLVAATAQPILDRAIARARATASRDVQWSS